MTNDPVLENVIVSTEISFTQKLKRVSAKHRTSIVLGAALAVSMTLNYVLMLKPEGTTKYFLTSDDVAYLNSLLEEDQKE